MTQKLGEELSFFIRAQNKIEKFIYIKSGFKVS